MNNCPNCNFPLHGERVCPSCKAKLDHANQIYKKDPERTINKEQDLKEAYVGKEYANFYDTHLSIWALIFGIFYVWYRKMYLWFFAWLLVIIATEVLFFKNQIIPIIIYVIIAIIMAFVFNDSYSKFVDKKIAKIKRDNKDKNQQELMYLCIKKGGTTKLPYVAAVVIPIALILFIIPGVNERLNNERKKDLIEDAERALQVVQEDIMTNGLTEEKTYDIESINMLLDRKLDKSPFGLKYDKVLIKVTQGDNGYQYNVCIMDENRNGFKYTDSKIISEKVVELKMDSPSCN